VTLDDAAALADRQEPWVRRAAWAVFALAVLAFLVRGADNPPDPFVAASPAAAVREAVDGFESILFRITKSDGSFADLCALLADDEASRQQGLMDRTDLAGHDGMVFRFDEPIAANFYMYKTRIPLSIGWFDATGALVKATQMEPCASKNPDECPRYGTDGVTYLHALEVPKGRLGALGVVPGSTISFPDAPCP
jgi:uncharacterized membrane protein (UPF0127 family)